MLSSKPTADKILNVRSILDAAEDGRALTVNEAVCLLGITGNEEITRLRQVADKVRHRQTGDRVCYDTGVSLFLTNLCEMAPALYPYPKKNGEKGAYTLTIDHIDATLEQAQARNVRCLNLSGGGFWPTLCVPGLEAATALKTHVKILNHIREKLPTLHIQGFSPDEVEFLCILNSRNERYILELLMDHGLETLGGFGAELLVDSVRASLSPRKAKVKRWLEIVAAAHRLGLPVIARTEAGPMETLAQRVRHLDVIRRFQQKHPGAFKRLECQMWLQPPVQLKPTSDNSLTSHSHRLKLIALTRLYLGEVLPEQQTIWLPDQVEEAQEALSWGASHFGGTDTLAYFQFLSDVTGSASYFAESELRDLIRETGKESRPFL